MPSAVWRLWSRWAHSIHQCRRYFGVPESSDWSETVMVLLHDLTGVSYWIQVFLWKVLLQTRWQVVVFQGGVVSPSPTPNPKDQTLLYSVLSSFTCPVLLKLPGAKVPRLFSSQQEISTRRRAGAFISPWAISIAQRLVGPRKQLRQIIQVNTTMLTAGQPVYYLQAWSRILTRNYQKQSI